MSRPRPKASARAAPPTLSSLFVTQIYQAQLQEAAALNGDLEAACLSIAEDDAAGQAWCEAHAYAGYTSYASLDDLDWRDPSFKALGKALDQHVAAFAEAAHFELDGQALVRNSLWINVLEPGGMHSGHIHPHSVVSGTYYVTVPDGASALRFEDPRLAMMMAAPPRRADAPPTHQAFAFVQPTAGAVLLWESYLRHEVLVNQADEVRISISFNYGLAAAPARGAPSKRGRPQD
jgi:uncharacterized protein (TIGR02466 family)